MHPNLRHPLLLLLAAGLPLLGWQVYRAFRSHPIPAPAASAAAPAPVVPPQWRSLFDRSVPPDERLALARTVDVSFPLALLDSWTALLTSSPETRALETDFTIYNEILDQSRQRNLHPATLTPFLLAALHNTTLHPVCRDYAAQHLSLWLSAITTGSPHETDPTRRRDALEALCRIPGDPAVRQLSLPGTVLLALADLANAQPESLAPHWPALDASLVSLAADPATPAILRLSAVQTAALGQRPATLPALRRLLADPASPDSLLMAAAGALGRIGDASARPALTTLAASGTAAAPAAATALKRLPQ